MPQAERDYSHRDVVDKLGVKPGFAIAVDETSAPVDRDLVARALERAGRGRAREDEPVDVALVGVTDATDVEAILRRWRARIDPAGGIWLLTPKRGHPGYVDQNELILAGPAASVVDNKICSISESTSAMRFVIRRADRPSRT